MDELTRKTELQNLDYYFARHRINCNCRHCREAWKIAELLGRGFNAEKLVQARGERDELETEGGIMGEIIGDES